MWYRHHSDINGGNISDLMSTFENGFAGKLRENCENYHPEKLIKILDICIENICGGVSLFRSLLD